MTAWVTLSPSFASASARSFCRIIAEISGGEYVLPPMTTWTSPFDARDDLVRHVLDRLLDDRVVELAAHEALDREDRVLGVRHGLPARDGAYEPLAGLRVDRDDRRRDPASFGVLEHGRLAGFEDSHRRVGRPEVDSDHLRHGSASCLFIVCGWVVRAVVGRPIVVEQRAADYDLGGSQQAAAGRIARPDDVPEDRLGHVGVGLVDERLVACRVEIDRRWTRHARGRDVPASL